MAYENMFSTKALMKAFNGGYNRTHVPTALRKAARKHAKRVRPRPEELPRAPRSRMEEAMPRSARRSGISSSRIEDAMERPTGDYHEYREERAPRRERRAPQESRPGFVSRAASTAVRGAQGAMAAYALYKGTKQIYDDMRSRKVVKPASVSLIRPKGLGESLGHRVEDSK
jgi:hypothetical protein